MTAVAEKNRSDQDQIQTGKIIASQYHYNMAGLFILYRGVSMENKWVENYKKKVNHNTFK